MCRTTRWLRFGVPAMATVVAAVVAVISGGSPARAATGTTPSGTYNGSAGVTVTTYEYCGPGFSRVPSGRYTYSVPAQLAIGARGSDGRAAERNPFSFSFAAGNLARAGGVTLASSHVVTVLSRDLAGNPRDPRLLLTYWQFTYANGTLSGRLVDTHAREAVAANLFTVSKPTIPCRTGYGNLPTPAPLVVGSTLRGRLLARSADLTLSSATSDGLVSFTLRFRAG